MNRPGPLPPARRDPRWRAMLLVIVAITAGGMLIATFSNEGWWKRHSMDDSVMQDDPDPASEMTRNRTRKEIHLRFQQGVAMLHAKRYEHAMTAFHRVLELDPAMPEAHVDMGFALVGLRRYDVARDFFLSAIALRKEQANAYYGLAMSLDELRDRPGAIGAMRTFVHLSKPDDPYRRKAEAALWEWQAGSRSSTSGAGAGAPAIPAKRNTPPVIPENQNSPGKSMAAETQQP